MNRLSDGKAFNLWCYSYMASELVFISTFPAISKLSVIKRNEDIYVISISYNENLYYYCIRILYPSLRIMSHCKVGKHLSNPDQSSIKKPTISKAPFCVQRFRNFFYFHYYYFECHRYMQLCFVSLYI